MPYTLPTSADLKIRFPAFAAVPDVTVEYWLTDARVTVLDTWIENDRAPAEMALAAHNMAMNGLGVAGGAVGDLAAMGVTDFKSASMSVSFDASRIQAMGSGGYTSTRYRFIFRTYLRRNTGPFLAGCIDIPVCC